MGRGCSQRDVALLAPELTWCLGTLQLLFQVLTRSSHCLENIKVYRTHVDVGITLFWRFMGALHNGREGTALQDCLRFFLNIIKTRVYSSISEEIYFILSSEIINLTFLLFI